MEFIAWVLSQTTTAHARETWIVEIVVVRWRDTLTVSLYGEGGYVCEHYLPASQ